MAKLKVLFTGAAGRIGRHVTPLLQQEFELRTLDRKPVESDPGWIKADLADRGALLRAMQDAEVVLHFAAYPDEGPFLEELVPANVVGLFHVFEAAREAGVRRIVFASSCQVILGQKRDEPLPGEAVPRPCSLYGATKALGEAMGWHYHRKHGLEFVALRIGWFQDYDSEELKNRSWGGRRLWLSPRDCAKLLICAATRPGVGFAVVNGTSLTEKEVMSLTEAREVLGYEPQDDVAKLFPKVSPDPSDPTDPSDSTDRITSRCP